MTTRLNRAGCRTLAMLWLGLVAAPVWGIEYIAREEWPDIRRGVQVTQHDRLAGVIEEFDRLVGANIVILYPGGEAGYDWALELRDWFVALGVPSRLIALRPGSGVPGSIGLDVERGAFE